ncbi:MAG: hypothetical protein ACI8UO_004163 [Verrucomicrobiales bacterium]
MALHFETSDDGVLVLRRELSADAIEAKLVGDGFRLRRSLTNLAIVVQGTRRALAHTQFFSLKIIVEVIEGWRGDALRRRIFQLLLGS